MLSWRKKWRLLLQIFLTRLAFKLGLAPRLIAYIGSSEALPPPLSNDEELFLLNKLATGDRAVKSVLIERNLRLVVYIARKFENTGVGNRGLSIHWDYWLDQGGQYSLTRVRR